MSDDFKPSDFPPSPLPDGTPFRHMRGLPFANLGKELVASQIIDFLASDKGGNKWDTPITPDVVFSGPNMTNDVAYRDTVIAIDPLVQEGYLTWVDPTKREALLVTEKLIDVYKQTANRAHASGKDKSADSFADKYPKRDISKPDGTTHRVG